MVKMVNLMFYVLYCNKKKCIAANSGANTSPSGLSSFIPYSHYFLFSHLTIYPLGPMFPPYTHTIFLGTYLRALIPAGL